MNQSNGYTLLEVLMSTAIVIVVVGGGISAFRGFEEREALVSAGRQFAVTLRDVQGRASNGEKSNLPPPEGCGDETLVSWRLRVTSVRNYDIEMICENNTTIVVSSDTLETGVLFDSGTYQIDFEVLTGKVTTPLVFRLTNESDGVYDITVNSTGLINEGSYETL